MQRSKSSKRWLKEHFSDPFVQKARKEGYRSRAVYKLLEIQEKHRIVNNGDIVVELGAAPGSWTEVVAKIVGKQGKIFALDLLDFHPVDNTEIIQGDFNDDKIYHLLLEKVKGSEVSCILSDMLPNATGIKKVDQFKSVAMAEDVIEFAHRVLGDGGNLLLKVLQGPGFEDLVRILRSNFAKVAIKKPKASRDRSQEVYLLAMQYEKASL